MGKNLERLTSVPGRGYGVLADSSISRDSRSDKVSEMYQKGKKSVLEVGESIFSTDIYGIINGISPLSVFVPYLKNTYAVHIKEGQEFKLADRVVLNLIKKHDKQETIFVKIKDVFGNLADPESDCQAIMTEFGLKEDFPEDVLQEIQNLPEDVSEVDWAKRTDHTGLECITIDANATKDFDDALSVHRDKRGHFHLGVHIADVSHYVRPGSKLDAIAAQRCNSIYFSEGKCIPMLPKILSEKLCSLVENKPRLAISILMEFDPAGYLLRYNLQRSVIRNKKHLTYAMAQAILDKPVGSIPYSTTLYQLSLLGLLLKKQRERRGCIIISIPKLIFHCQDGSAIPFHVTHEQANLANQMVEEIMLKTNEVMVEHFTKKVKKPFLYRVQKPPNWGALVAFDRTVRALGYNFPLEPRGYDYQNLLTRRAYGQNKNLLVSLFIRCMETAFYSTKNFGHFGLALKKYCRVTSPIRRYSDITVMRLLFPGDPALSQVELEDIARKCSEKAKNSFKAECTWQTLWKYRLLYERFKKSSRDSYHGVISKIEWNGVTFTIDCLQLDGFLSLESLSSKRPKSESAPLLGGVFFIGKKIIVALKSIDLIHLNASWVLC